MLLQLTNIWFLLAIIFNANLAHIRLIFQFKVEVVTLNRDVLTAIANSMVVNHVAMVHLVLNANLGTQLQVQAQI